VRLILLLGWKILFGIRQDHKKLKCEDLPYSTREQIMKFLKMNNLGFGFIWS
jgi:hypothetical protein